MILFLGGGEVVVVYCWMVDCLLLVRIVLVSFMLLVCRFGLLLCSFCRVVFRYGLWIVLLLVM